MRLTELAPSFVRVTDARGSFTTDCSREQAQGIEFLCPKCFAENGGPIGTHAVICWDPSVPQTMPPRPGRWNLVGEDFDHLSLVAGSSSVQLTGGCAAHFFVREGEVVPA